MITVCNSSCGKVMFSQASIILSKAGRCTPPGQTPLPLARQTSPWPGRHLPGQADTPRPGRQPLAKQTPNPVPSARQTSPGQADTTPARQTPPWADSHCSGRYASYWNVFLFLECKHCIVSQFVKWHLLKEPCHHFGPLGAHLQG